MQERLIDIDETLKSVERTPSEGEPDLEATGRGSGAGPGLGFGAVESARGRLYHFAAINA